VSKPREDDDGESDPEDSEVPWTCTVNVAGKPPFSSTVSTLQARGFPGGRTATKLKPPKISSAGSHGGATAITSFGSQVDPIANYFLTRSTPIADQTQGRNGLSESTPPESRIPPQDSLSIPDIDMSSVIVRKRVATPAGDGTGNLSMPSFSLDGSRGNLRDTALVLTTEDIKDVVVSTVLLLVVRGAMGGVGKDKRKGDGSKPTG